MPLASHLFSIFSVFFTPFFHFQYFLYLINLFLTPLDITFSFAERLMCVFDKRFCLEATVLLCLLQWSYDEILLFMKLFVTLIMLLHSRSRRAAWFSPYQLFYFLSFPKHIANFTKEQILSKNLPSLFQKIQDKRVFSKFDFLLYLFHSSTIFWPLGNLFSLLLLPSVYSLSQPTFQTLWRTTVYYLVSTKR